MRRGNVGGIGFLALVVYLTIAEEINSADLTLPIKGEQVQDGNGSLSDLNQGENSEVSKVMTRSAKLLEQSESKEREEKRPEDAAVAPQDVANEKDGTRKSAGTGIKSASEITGSRVIHPSEYYLPVLNSGFPNPCTHEGQLHFLWSPDVDCFVCMCSTNYGGLTLVCASCTSCQAPTPTVLPPAPTIYPPYVPTTPDDITVLPPIPPVEVSCDPLPTNTPFENPLNPCQTCICRLLVSAYGAPDVQIVCQENYQCVNQPDFPTPPPLPPIPPPQPLCDKFPKNVWFPHPNEECNLCKCIVLPNLAIDITCIPNPDCKKIFPTPTPVTEPIPWPPEPTTLRPLPPGPLPGPPPHESCTPFPPRTPFQHPWDECQMCICTEAYSGSHTEVEVNCFTKRECCIEYPPTSLPLPSGSTLSPALIVEQLCEYKPKEIDFIHPEDPCRTCKCEVFGDFLAPTCKRLNIPACKGFKKLTPNQPNVPVTFMEPVCRMMKPNTPFAVGCNLCVCQTVYRYVIAKCLPQPDCNLPYLSVSDISLGQGAANADVSIQFQNTQGQIPSAQYNYAHYPGLANNGINPSFGRPIGAPVNNDWLFQNGANLPTGYQGAYQNSGLNQQPLYSNMAPYSNLYGGGQSKYPNNVMSTKSFVPPPSNASLPKLTDRSMSGQGLSPQQRQNLPPGYNNELTKQLLASMTNNTSPGVNPEVPIGRQAFHSPSADSQQQVRRRRGEKIITTREEDEEEIAK